MKRIILALVVTFFAITGHAKVYHEGHLTQWYIDSRTKVIKTSVYDYELNKKHFAFRLENFIGKPSRYSELYKVLKQASAGDKVYIYFVNNNGGYSSAADKIIEAIDKSSAEVVVVIQGRAMSAAANITCAADKIYMTQASQISFHLSQFVPEKAADEKNLKSLAQFHYGVSKQFWDTRCAKRGLINKEESNRAYREGRRLLPQEMKPFVHISDTTVRNRIPEAYREEGFE